MFMPDMVLPLTPLMAEVWVFACAGMFCAIALALLVYDLNYNRG